MARFQRHNRILTGLRRLFPVSASKPDATREIAPWLSDVVQFSYDLPGDIRANPLTAPAVATNFAITVPGGELWRVIAMSFTLTADANAANRTFRVRILDPGGGLILLFVAETLQVANETVSYFLDHRGVKPNAIAGAQIYLPIPQNLLLLSGMTIDTAVQNIQAGDQINTPFVWREIRAHPEIPA